MGTIFKKYLYILRKLYCKYKIAKIKVSDFFIYCYKYIIKKHIDIKTSRKTIYDHLSDKDEMMILNFKTILYLIKKK